MRVCLDLAMGRPWHEVIPRPAIRHASVAQLKRAVAVAEAVLNDPGSLPARNDASLQMRGKARGSAPGPR